MCQLLPLDILSLRGLIHAAEPVADVASPADYAATPSSSPFFRRSRQGTVIRGTRPAGRRPRLRNGAKGGRRPPPATFFEEGADGADVRLLAAGDADLSRTPELDNAPPSEPRLLLAPPVENAGVPSPCLSLELRRDATVGGLPPDDAGRESRRRPALPRPAGGLSPPVLLAAPPIGFRPLVFRPSPVSPPEPPSSSPSSAGGFSRSARGRKAPRLLLPGAGRSSDGDVAMALLRLSFL